MLQLSSVEAYLETHCGGWVPIGKLSSALSLRWGRSLAGEGASEALVIGALDPRETGSSRGRGGLICLDVGQRTVTSDTQPVDR